MGQSRRLLVDAAGHGFERHVAVLELPLVVLFEQDGSDEPRDDASHNVANSCGELCWIGILSEHGTAKDFAPPP